MTEWCAPLVGVWGSCAVWWGSPVGEVFGWSLCWWGVWWWACGYRSCVWGFPTGRFICLGLGFVEAFIDWGCTPTKICWGRCLGDGVFWDSGSYFGSLVVWVWVFLWGASCGAGVCRPSVLIRWRDGFLGILLVGLFHCIVLGFLGLHGFVKGVYVGLGIFFCKAVL